VLVVLFSLGDFRDGRHHAAVSAVSLYWHFVDVVWVILYTLVYLLSNGARAPL